MHYKFTLQPYKGPATRYTCPQCGKHRIFCRYIDTETGEPIADHVGRCNREVNCGYHFTPREYFKDSLQSTVSNKYSAVNSSSPAQSLTVDYSLPTESVFPFIPFDRSMANWDENNFVLFLLNRFGARPTVKLIDRYLIGTSNKWRGATVFWQKDINGRLRTGKIMLYNAATGKRVKQPYNHISWMHSYCKFPVFNLQQCLFGEHLLSKNKWGPVAIVESEKTAIIASIFYPDNTWLATGSLSNLTPQKCAVLTGRRIILYPDFNGFNKWSEYAGLLRKTVPGALITVSDYLQRTARDMQKQQGWDLADYLMKGGV